MKACKKLATISLLVALIMVPNPVRAGDDALVGLFRSGRHVEAFHEAMLRIVHDPQGDVSFEALSLLEKYGRYYHPGLFRHLMKLQYRKLGRDYIDVLKLVEAIRRDRPLQDGYYDPDRARRLFLEVAQKSGRPLMTGHALFFLAKHHVEVRPEKAAEVLRLLVENRRHQVSPAQSALAHLLLATCRGRTEAYQEQERWYRRGLEAHRELVLDPEGAVEPYFRHGLAEALARQGKRRQARRELRAVLDRFPEYPAQGAAWIDLTVLEG